MDAPADSARLSTCLSSVEARQPLYKCTVGTDQLRCTESDTALIGLVKPYGSVSSMSTFLTNYNGRFPSLYQSRSRDGAVATSLQYLAVLCRRCLQLCNRLQTLKGLVRLRFLVGAVSTSRKAIPHSTGTLLGLVRSAAPRRACPIPEHFHSILPRPLRVQKATATSVAPLPGGRFSRALS